MVAPALPRAAVVGGGIAGTLASLVFRNIGIYPSVAGRGRNVDDCPLGSARSTAGSSTGGWILEGGEESNGGTMQSDPLVLAAHDADRTIVDLESPPQLPECSDVDVAKRKPTKKDGYEKVEVISQVEWRGWLVENHVQKESIWLVTYKKLVPDKYVPYNEIVEEALCFGWIDSTRRKYDDTRTMLLLAPRKSKSVWSKSNKDRATKLEQRGLMSEAGIMKVNKAKKDGSWAFLDDVEAMAIPDDLKQALKKNKVAQKNFDNFTDSAIKYSLYYIKQAKKASTRERRIQKVAELAKANTQIGS